MLLGLGNQGFILTYFSSKKQAERSKREFEMRGVIFYDNLERVEAKMHKQWICGEHITIREEKPVPDLITQNFYFDSEGNFAKVMKRANMPEKPMYIRFVGSTLNSLEKAVKSFELPYDEKEVRKNNEGPFTFSNTHGV